MKFPIENGDIPVLCDRLPEGSCCFFHIMACIGMNQGNNLLHYYSFFAAGKQ